MTILEWIKALTWYTLDDGVFEKVALDRNITDVTASADTLTIEQKELMTADLIFTAVVLSPSSTSSLSEQHNGFQRTVGSETDIYKNDKIAFAKAIYKKYGDPKYDMLGEAHKPIRQIGITDTI